MGFWSRARDYVEEKVDRVKTRTHEWREPRHHHVRDRAAGEYRGYVRETVDKRNRGDISTGLAERRIQRARKRLKRTSVPIENRVAKVGKEVAAGWVDRQKERFRNKNIRKNTYNWVSGGAKSYNKSVPSAFGLGTGKGKRRSQDKSNWNMLTGSKGSGSNIGGGFGMLYGPSASKGGSRRGRKKKGGGGSDPFWMLGG